MSNAYFNPPIAVNEPVLTYAPDSPEREELLATYKAMKKKKVEAPLYIGDEKIKTGDTVTMTSPHDHELVLGKYHKADTKHVKAAIKAAMKARTKWSKMPWQDRAAIFLKAADLLSGPYRAKMNAATMLCQSKNAYQAEIDSACEMADFFRFNVQYMADIYSE
ncbi:MAG: aldehyde dehydrogenase family protein, partial [Flavobacteriales bacterium]|nr:aldehyde dehydrogenase family protein [Flavobacteriales bacterium]